MLAVGAAYARRRRPREPPAEQGDPRADELRRRLAESRDLAGEREEFEGGETTVDEAEPTGADLEERRRRIHEAGRAAAGEMRGDADTP